MAEHSTKLELTHDVESRILKSLKKRKGVATAGDVAADTGLGYEHTDWALQQLLNLYKSHLDVDDEGNLRYRFDPTFTRRGADPGRAWRQFKRTAWRAFMAFFKVWTMVMLVGYTVLFVLLLLALGIAAFSARMSDDDRGGGGSLGMLPFMLVARFLEFMFWWNIFSGPDTRRQTYAHPRGAMMGGRRAHKRPDKPFYQKIFDYLFGPQPAARDPYAPGRAFAQFVRSRQGRITAADWASRTGQSLEEASSALTASLGRFSGDIDVTDDGVLVYRFDNLMVTADEDARAAGTELAPIWQRPITLPSFTGNPGSSNTWITVFNGFNLFMALFVLFMTVGLPLAAIIFLGWVPLVFSTIFFAIPMLRKIAYNRRKRHAAQENERRRALQVVFESAQSPQHLQPLPAGALPDEFQDRLLLEYDGDIAVTNSGQTVYTFSQLATQLDAGRLARQTAGSQVAFGKTVFSSDEQEKSLDEAAMDDFDRRLALELGGDVFEMGVNAPASVSAGR